MIQHRAQTFLLDCLRYFCFSSAACDIDHGTTGTWRCMHISGIILPSYQTCWKSYRTQKLWKTLTVRSSGGSVHAFICTTQDSLGSVIGVGDFGEGMLTILDLVPSLAPAVDSLRCDAPACAGGSRCLVMLRSFDPKLALLSGGAWCCRCRCRRLLPAGASTLRSTNQRMPTASPASWPRIAKIGATCAKP
jgi:hypothetical protein